MKSRIRDNQRRLNDAARGLIHPSPRRGLHSDLARDVANVKFQQDSDDMMPKFQILFIFLHLLTGNRKLFADYNGESFIQIE